MAFFAKNENGYKKSRLLAVFKTVEKLATKLS
jgi:hypothetical protein